jgi:hypothetical protein
MPLDGPTKLAIVIQITALVRCRARMPEKCVAKEDAMLAANNANAERWERRCKVSNEFPWNFSHYLDEPSRKDAI